MRLETKEVEKYCRSAKKKWEIYIFSYPHTHTDTYAHTHIYTYEKTMYEDEIPGGLAAKMTTWHVRIPEHPWRLINSQDLL